MFYSNVIGLIGESISHSLSPNIHNQSFAKLDLKTWIYLPLPVNKFDLKEAILGLRALSFKGANVTIPYKEMALAYMDQVSKEAKIIGAINTISIDADRNLIGHNTDYQGFINSILEYGLAPKKLKVLVLGAGGSSKAISYGLLEGGCKKIIVLNRDKEKAEKMVNQYKNIFKDQEIIADGLEKVKEYVEEVDLIVNCTSLGAYFSKEQMPISESIKFKKSQVVYDLIYHPNKTRLLEHAENCEARAINGLSMLIHQAALAFKIWTNKDMPKLDI